MSQNSREPGTESGTALQEATQAEPASLLQRSSRSSLWPLLTLWFLVAVSIAGIWTLMRPTYQAHCMIHVKPIIPWILLTGHVADQFRERYDAYMNTQVSLIRSPTVLGRVLDRDDVRRTPWFRNPSTSLMDKLKGTPSPLERLQDDLSVSPRSRTELLDVTMKAPKAEDAATIVNAVVDEYLKYHRAKVDEEAEQRLRKRIEKFTELKQEIDGRKKILDRLRKDLDEREPRLEGVRGELRSALWQCAQSALALVGALEGELDRFAKVTKDSPSGRAERPAPKSRYEDDTTRRVPMQSDLGLQAQNIRLLWDKAQTLQTEKAEAEAKLRDASIAAEATQKEHHKLWLWLFVADPVPYPPVEVLSRAGVPSKPSSDRRWAWTLVVLLLGAGGTALLALRARRTSRVRKRLR